MVSSIMAIPDGGSEDDQALLDRIAKREERRQRRMRDALERQKSLDPAVGDGLDGTNGTEERSSSHSEHQRDGAVEEPTHNEVSTHETSSSREKEEEEKKKEEESTAAEETIKVEAESVVVAAVSETKAEEEKADAEEEKSTPELTEPVRSTLQSIYTTYTLKHT